MSPSDPSLPARPDLEQERKLARELLRAFRAGDAGALTRVRAQLPDKPKITLADAQYVLAREHGCRSWAELRRYIEATRRAAERPALDAARVALREGDAAALRRLLESHAELRALVNEPLFAFDSPALVHVAGRGDVALVDVLLDFGADPNLRSSWWAGGFHPLHSATGEVAERLLERGAVPDACAAANLDRPALLAAMLAEDPARVRERGGDGQTPLHFARSRAVVDLLLDAGAEPDARDVDHRGTPAQWMLDRRRGAGRYDLAGYLVERGATADIFLAAALGLAERAGEMVEADPSLLDLRTGHGDYGAKPPSADHIYTWTIGVDRTPLQVAAQFEQHATVEIMAAHATPRQRLVAALAEGDEDAARALLAEDPTLFGSLDARDRSALPEAGWAGNARAVALMLDLGLGPDATNEGGATVLHTAAWQGSAECVAKVLEHPAAASLLEMRDTHFGATPLGWCSHGSVHGPRGEHARIARLLLEAGAAPPTELGEASEEVMAVVEGWRA